MKTSSLHPTQREGVVLLVVISMLALFAAVGLSFVFFAESEANNAKIARQAAGSFDAHVDPELLLNFFLGELIYDTDNPYSSVRGHGLARGAFGYNPGGINTIPFNGVGRLRYTPAGAGGYAGVDNYYLVNYTKYPGDTQRDPEKNKAGQYVAGNGPWTYPDLDNMMLASVNADGEVLMPSGHRPWVFSKFGISNPWASSDPKARYLTLRVHPSYHNGFEDIAEKDVNEADVKNLDGSPGMAFFFGGSKKYATNDSYWIDLDFPVLTAPTGIKYKPLFAPLVMDLDNKINLNVAGNLGSAATTGTAHKANQGWGPWEINWKYIANNNTPTDLKNLFLGTSATLPGRYQFNSTTAANVPSGSTAPGWNPAILVPPYAQIDFNGSATGPVQLPGTVTTGAPPAFPTFPGYSNKPSTTHPGQYNPLQPPATNRQFHPYHMEATLRYRGTGSPGLISDFFRLAPTDFANRRTQLLTTVRSADFDRAGMMPWYQSPNDYQVKGNIQGPPTGDPMNFPGVGSALVPGGEFSIDGKSVLAELGRVDLNRFLPPYPHMGQGTTAASYSATALTTTAAPRYDANPAALTQAQAALDARQTLANDIYRRLLKVVGVPPAPPGGGAAPPDDVLIPRRWLAQLAVNIVDFIDEDDLSTPFRFFTLEDDPTLDPTLHFAPDDTAKEFPLFWVFGTEMPRVVINEVLTQYQLPMDGAKDGPFDVRFWVELYNPMPATAVTNTQAQVNQAIRLHIPGTTSLKAYSPYQVLITKNAGGDGLKATPKNNSNVLGIPEQRRVPQPLEEIPATVNPLDNSTTLVASQIKAQGFFLLGPAGPNYKEINDTIKTGGTKDAKTPWFRTTNMSYKVEYKQPDVWEWKDPLDNDNLVAINDRTQGVNVVLRRLANPFLPEDNQPFISGGGQNKPNPNYNPYITVDYVKGVSLNEVKSTAKNCRSWGRSQPYAANSKLWVNQTAATLTQQTMADHNTGKKAPYDWLAHLDRKLISPMELLLVSACKPHQLTQVFVDDDGVAHKHLAPWFDENTRLYRLFELLGTTPRMAGLKFHGLIPGKVNINTLVDPEVFRALCDPQVGNSFNLSDVDSTFQNLFKSRNPTYPIGYFSENDRPFKGMGTGVVPPGDPQYPQGLGIEDTLLRRMTDTAADPKLLELAKHNHPYLKWQLLNKLYNNLTTRSNVFAVWVTVGFFEVLDDSVRPAKLGKEIGRAENRHIRHRMFAIVDRSRTVVPSLLAKTTTPILAKSPPKSTSIAVNPGAVGTFTWPSGKVKFKNPNLLPVKSDASLSLKPGMRLLISGNDLITGAPQEEVMLIESVGANTFTASPTKSFQPGADVKLPGIEIISDPTNLNFGVAGNPGPQQRFDVRQNSFVVPHFSVIQ